MSRPQSFRTYGGYSTLRQSRSPRPTPTNFACGVEQSRPPHDDAQSNPPHAGCSRYLNSPQILIATTRTLVPC